MPLHVMNDRLHPLSGTVAPQPAWKFMSIAALSLQLQPQLTAAKDPNCAKSPRHADDKLRNDNDDMGNVMTVTIQE